MAYGDLFRLAKYALIVGLVSIVGYFYFGLMEGDWGPEYYAEVYGKGLLANFDAMRMTLMIGGLICVAIALILYFMGKAKDKKMAMPAKITVNVGKLPEEV